MKRHIDSHKETCSKPVKKAVEVIQVNVPKNQPKVIKMVQVPVPIKPKNNSKFGRNCQFCDTVFHEATPEKFLRHLKIHENLVDIKNFQCFLCAKIFKTRDEFLKHLMFQNETKKCFLCEVPDFINRDLLTHIKLHHENYMKSHWFHCPKCENYYMRKFEISHSQICIRDENRAKYLHKISTR